MGNGKILLQALDGVAFRAGAAFHPAHGTDALRAQVFPVALAAVDASVRDTALRALVTGDAVGQDLPHDGASRLLQGSGDCTDPPVRTQAVLYLRTVSQGQMWHGIVLLSHGGLPGLIARLNAHPSPGGGVLAGGSQTMHSLVWIEGRTLRLPGDTTPVELNAHPRVCVIQRTKRVRLTFPVTSESRRANSNGQTRDPALYRRAGPERQKKSVKETTC